MNIYGKLLPVVKHSGFRMEGYYVWCGSTIKGEDGRYYLFAARWPKKTTFPDGYMTDSEIVLAVTDDLAKPFQFEKVIIGKREGDYWDSMMAHNPFILKISEEYVLFYIGNPDGSAQRRAIGFARSKSLTEGWVRSETAIALPPNANNPSVLVKEDGVYLYFRDGNLKVSVARADRYDGEYTVLNDNVCPKGMVEDMYVYPVGDHFEMIAEDAGGAYTGIPKAGAHFVSEDAVHWVPSEPCLAYDYDILYDDGSREELQRRERPSLFSDKTGTYLFTTAKIGGEDRLTGGETWNMVQKISGNN